MRCLLCVCLGVLAWVAIFVVSGRGQTPALQKGVSVEMAATANATPMPAADDANAWIVAVVRDGSIFFGTEKVTPEGLAEAMKRRPRNRDQKLYIKADARAPFADVAKVLQAGRTAGFEAPVLLTSQTEPAAPGTIVSPRGLDVLAGAPSNADAVVVQVLDMGGPKSDVRLNGADVNVDVLRNTLGRMLGNLHQRLVIVKAEGKLPFGQVAHVIDICRGVGLEVAVAGVEL